MKSTIEDEKLKEKLGRRYDDIKTKLNEAEQVLYVDDVTMDEYKKAQKELENFINPIMHNIVQSGGGEYKDNVSPEPIPRQIT